MAVAKKMCRGLLILLYVGLVLTVSEPFAVYRGFVRTDSGLRLLGSQSSVAQLSLRHDAVHSVLAKVASGREIKTDKDYYVKILVGVVIVVWISCIILGYALGFIRRLWLWNAGYRMGLEGILFPWRDGSILREMAEAQDSEELRVLSTWINTAYWVLVFGAIFGGMLAAAIIFAFGLR